MKECGLRFPGASALPARVVTPVLTLLHREGSPGPEVMEVPLWQELGPVGHLAG